MPKTNMKKPNRFREMRTHTFNPDIYNRYKIFCESRDVPLSRDLERYMTRQLNNYA